MQRKHKTSSVVIGFLALLAVAIGGAVSPAPARADSTITVTTIADNTTTDTLCSLREAIHNANSDAANYPDCVAGSGNDTIVFSPSVQRF